MLDSDRIEDARRPSFVSAEQKKPEESGTHCRSEGFVSALILKGGAGGALLSVRFPLALTAF